MSQQRIDTSDPRLGASPFLFSICLLTACVALAFDPSARHVIALPAIRFVPPYASTTHATCAANMSSSPRPSSQESFEFLSPNPNHDQFPFPQHQDWTVRPSSTGGRYQPRRGSTSSSIHSVGGALDTAFKGSMGQVREQSSNGTYTKLLDMIAENCSC